MRVIVLGAGLLGVTSAYYLQQRGHDVTVIDRQATPGRRNQFCQRRADLGQPRRALGQPERAAQGAAVAGQGRRAAAVSHARRHAPVALGPAVSARMHAGAHAPQHRADRAPGHLQPRQPCSSCAATRASQYDQRTQGILHFYTTQKEFDGALGAGRADARTGLRTPAISAPTRPCASNRPCAHIRPQLAGATYTAEDESGDANRFARELVDAVRKAAACSS